MKIKNDPSAIAKMDKEEAEKKRERERRIERERERRIMDGEKKDLSLEKYRVALERLQLNWIQLNITCIAVGFTAYKFYYSRILSGDASVRISVNGWHIGICLILIGIVTLVFGTLQHRENVTRLKLQVKKMQYSLSLRLSYFLVFFSLMILLLVLLKG